MKSTQELGAVLREAREARKASVGELSDKTGLPEKYLQALEDGDHDLLPGKAYARIYYLNYARALQLDTELLMLDWPHPEGEQAPAPVVETPNPWPNRILIAISAIAVVVIIYALWPSKATSPKPPQVDSSEDVTQPIDSAALIDTAGDTTLSQPEDTLSQAAAQATQATPPVQPKPPQTFALEVRASSQSWVVIEADGDTVEASVLAGGGSLHAEASDDFVLTAARPEVVRVLLDGKEVSLPEDRTRPLVRHRIDPRAKGERP